MPINSQKQQALQTVLSEWPLWGISGTRTPEIITQFRQGRSNDSYLLRIATEHYVYACGASTMGKLKTRVMKT